MSRALRVALLMTVLGAALVSTADAQRRRGLVDVSPSGERRGFWLEGGLGWGSESFKFDDESSWSESLGKPTFSLSLGGTPNPNLRIGAEMSGWWNSYQDFESGFTVTETLASLMAVGRVYPMRHAGLFLQGGAGLGVSGASVEFGTSTTETGFAYGVGAGWEVKLSPHLFLTPAAQYKRFAFEQRNEPTLRERLVNVSLSLTWQPSR